MNQVLKTNIEIESLNKDKAECLHLAFIIDNKNYLINVMQVKEVLECNNVTTISSQPEFIHGVIDLRGEIIPIVNIKKLLNLDNHLTHKHACILITETNFGKDTLNIGIAADNIHGLIETNTHKADACMNDHHVSIESLLGFEELKLLHSISTTLYQD